MDDQLTVIAMVRNEADILPGLLAHASTLFDQALVIDHRSTDGSREILEAARAEWPGLQIFDYGVQGYFQGALSTAFARKALKDGADWVFFLDADEFIDVPDRAALLGALPRDGTPACLLLWRNLCPTAFGTYHDFDLQQEFLFGPNPSRYGKVVLSRRILQHAPDFELALGNHTVLSAPGALGLVAPPIGELLHIPIRSHDRLEMKLETGVAAYRAKTKATKQPIEGFHWFELLEKMRGGTLDDDLLRAVALDYGEPIAGAISAMPHFERRRRIAPAGVIAVAPLPAVGGRCFARSRVETQKLDRAVAWQQLRAEAEGVTVLIDKDNQVTLKPRVVRPGGELAPSVFGALPSENSLPADDLSERRLDSAIDMAFSRVETLVPSAWSHLVPVMFGLIALLRPRRFVELGTHYGCSFFAACQAMQTLDLDAEAVAIDTWQGDPQAGLYPETVFEDFIQLLRTRYPERSHYIRSRFDDAIGCFEDGSIDLLHIDGLHEYEAVRADFESWLPKMSDRGVMILHDTTVYERGYGVWLLWRDIAVRYPSLNLLHCHGLGIVYVGKGEGRFAEMLRGLSADPARYLLLNSIARNLGFLSIGAATSGQEAEGALQAKVALETELSARKSEFTAVLAVREGKLAATRAELGVRLGELNTNRQVFTAMQAELATIRASTSWRLSAPVRLLGRVLRGNTRG
jgi:hypothetical protein